MNVLRRLDVDGFTVYAVPEDFCANNIADALHLLYEKAVNFYGADFYFEMCDFVATILDMGMYQYSGKGIRPLSKPIKHRTFYGVPIIINNSMHSMEITARK